MQAQFQKTYQQYRNTNVKKSEKHIAYRKDNNIKKKGGKQK